MKKSEMLQQLINIEKEKGENTTITMNYISYLETIKRMVVWGDREVT